VFNVSHGYLNRPFIWLCMKRKGRPGRQTERKKKGNVHHTDQISRYPAFAGKRRREEEPCHIPRKSRILHTGAEREGLRRPTGERGGGMAHKRNYAGRGRSLTTVRGKAATRQERSQRGRAWLSTRGRPREKERWHRSCQNRGRTYTHVFSACKPGRRGEQRRALRKPGQNKILLLGKSGGGAD